MRAVLAIDLGCAAAGVYVTVSLFDLFNNILLRPVPLLTEATAVFLGLDNDAVVGRHLGWKALLVTVVVLVTLASLWLMGVLRMSERCWWQGFQLATALGAPWLTLAPGFVLLYRSSLHFYGGAYAVTESIISAIWLCGTTAAVLWARSRRQRCVGAVTLAVGFAGAVGFLALALRPTWYLFIPASLVSSLVALVVGGTEVQQ